MENNEKSNVSLTTKCEEMMDLISLGSVFADLRIQMGLTQKDIASALNVCEKLVIDIENGQLTHIAIVFIKSYIRSYAKIVHLSPEEYEPYLNYLSQQHAEKKNQSCESDNVKQGSSILIGCVLIMSLFIVIVSYFVWYQNSHKTNFIEVSQYTSPSLQDNSWQ